MGVPMKGVILATALGAVLAAGACAGGGESDPAAAAGGNEGTGAGPSTSSTGGTAATGPSTTSSTSSTGGAGGSGGGPGGPGTVAACYADVFVNTIPGGPDYDQFSPVVGQHCLGTNHQDIAGVERVVFLGDSVTVGTPPTGSGDVYRSKLAHALADEFGLSGPSFLWETVDVINGVSLLQEDGDFASCSKWGARTDDLQAQMDDCFPQSSLGKRTLVVMTMGGNDLSNLTKDAIDGVPEAELWAQTEAFVDLQRAAVEWLKEDGRFPNGVYVVFANFFEFTDGTGDVESCDVSGLAGFDEPVPSPEQLAEMVVWANEQYAKIAVDTGTDMIFLLEEFCGHGFNAGDPSAPCYRGPGADTWFDLTCIHPNPTGHQHITDMFMAVVNE